MTNNLSPMMRQYLEVKEKVGDAFLFFRLGDFYEMFFEDAKTVSRLLELTLTGRDCGLSERAPMCGVPFHAADTYIAKLIAMGHKVAICEQITEPNGKGIVKREVVRIVTPGTVTEDVILDREKNNYLCCFYAGFQGKSQGMAAAWTDISTGEMSYAVLDSLVRVNELLSRITPTEIICNEEMLLKSVDLSMVKFGAACPFTLAPEPSFDYKAAYSVLENRLGREQLNKLKNLNECVCAAGALFAYLEQTQKRAMEHIRAVGEDNNDCMEIGFTARRTLEIFENTIDGKKRGSLIWALNRTKTGMGARTLRKWLESPLKNSAEINKRLDGVEELYNDNTFSRDQLVARLKDMRDIERLCGRLSCGTLNPKDCYALGDSLLSLKEIKRHAGIFKSTAIQELNSQISDHSVIAAHILSAISPDCANNIREGGVIKHGYDAELDQLLDIRKNANKILAGIEQNERELTGIKNLKIAYNKIFGFYIEVTKSQVGLVPYRYVRKQTLVGAERYITEEIKEIEDKVLHAEENAIAKEAKLYGELLEEIKKHTQAILLSAKALGRLDCLLGFAEIAKENDYTRPLITDSDKISIAEGRHPIVELILKNGEFTPNTTLLDGGENKIMLITGPNMAGKSIYMRQVALICIMAHIGCFVPAKSAEICVIDKIFTRVGASDDALTGRSTFMVEMSELSEILRGATDKSLILLDEIGRGTATYDGLSIAWAVLEFFSKEFNCKVLFSTHYHELTGLESLLDGIKNYKLSVRESGGTIVFLRKLMRGSANKSFGIEVAALSGLDDRVINRAKELLSRLDGLDLTKQTKASLGVKNVSQTSMFMTQSTGEILAVLSDIDLDLISPRHALDVLHDLKEKAKKL